MYADSSYVFGQINLSMWEEMADLWQAISLLDIMGMFFPSCGCHGDE